MECQELGARRLVPQVQAIRVCLYCKEDENNSKTDYNVVCF